MQDLQHTVSNIVLLHSICCCHVACAAIAEAGIALQHDTAGAATFADEGVAATGTFAEAAAKFQMQGYMPSSLTEDECPLNCDMLVFPVPIGNQWACTVVDMRTSHIFYGSSLQVAVYTHAVLTNLLRSMACTALCLHGAYNGGHSFLVGSMYACGTKIPFMFCHTVIFL